MGIMFFICLFFFSPDLSIRSSLHNQEIHYMPGLGILEWYGNNVLLLLLNEDLRSLQLGTAYFNRIRNFVYSVTLADFLSMAVDLHSSAFLDLLYICGLLENVTHSYHALLYEILF